MRWYTLHFALAELAPLPDREALVGCYLLAQRAHWRGRVPWNTQRAMAVTGLWRAEVD